MVESFERVILVTGHYGSGKTNLSVNLALDLRKQGREVALIDLDIVNPYFRSADFKELAAANGIELFAPPYANSNLDLPVIAPELAARLGGDATVIVDVGGDDAGAFALGGYAPRIKTLPYTMIYVINRYRYLTREVKEATALLSEIEAASRLKATHLVNNSHLSHLTSPQEVRDSLEYAAQAAGATGLPVAFTSVKRDVAVELSDLSDIYPVEIYVKTPW